MEPFKYGKPVTGKYFVNRGDELRELKNLVDSIKEGAGVNIALIGLRRTGKTSLLKNLQEDLRKDKQVVTVLIDCMGIPSKRSFTRYFLERVKEAYLEKTGDRKYIEKIKKLLRKSTSEILSRVSDIELSMAEYLSIKVGLRDDVEEEILLEKVLEYPEKLGKEKDLYFLIVLDEFPYIGIRWKETFVSRLRGIIQHQTRVMYILSGSAVSYMSDLVYSRDSPLYRQLKPIRIAPLPENIVRKFVQKRLNISEEVLGDYIEMTACLPDYMQRLGHILVYKFGQKEIKKKMLSEAYDDMLSELDAEFKGIMDRLNEKSGVYGEVVIALSKNERAYIIASEANIPTSSLSKYLNYLINLGIIKKIGRGRYRLTDVVFKEWINRWFN